MKTRHLAACTLLLASLTPLAADTVYRCPGGYSQEPCAEGTQLRVDDSRSQAQQRQSTAVARRDAQLAADMEKLRIQQERQPAPARIFGTPPTPATPTTTAAAPPAAKAGRKNKSAPEHFTATAPGSGKPKDRPAAAKKTPRPAG